MQADYATAYARAVRQPRGQGAPDHMSTYRIINPAHLTDTVRNLAQQLSKAERQINGRDLFTADDERARQRRRSWGITDEERQNWLTEHNDPDPFGTREALKPILADALEDAGCNDREFLDNYLRNPQVIWSTGHDRLLNDIAEHEPSWFQDSWDDHVRRFDAETDHNVAHAAAMKFVSDPDGVLAKTPGYVVHRPGGTATGGMRGNPPPGEIWTRPSYNNRRFVGFREKRGARLTAKELREWTRQQRAARRQQPPQPEQTQ